MTPEFEAAARAICRQQNISAYGARWEKGGLDQAVEDTWRSQIDATRAVLQAIATATARMIEAADPLSNKDKDVFKAAYESMIAAILED